jgi:hypothetical protein
MHDKINRIYRIIISLDNYLLNLFLNKLGEYYFIKFENITYISHTICNNGNGIIYFHSNANKKDIFRLYFDYELLLNRNDNNNVNQIISSEFVYNLLRQTIVKDILYKYDT